MTTFSLYSSFGTGGTLTGTTSNPGFATGQRSNDFGVWKYVGGQSYDAASEAYILFAAGPFVPGTQRISQTISLNGDTFTAWATVQFFDINTRSYAQPALTPKPPASSNPLTLVFYDGAPRSRAAVAR